MRIKHLIYCIEYLAMQMVNKALSILKFARNSAWGKDKKGFPIFALWNQQDKKRCHV